MDDTLLFILIGLALLATPVLALAGTIMAWGARKRIDALETRLALAESRLALGVAPAAPTVDAAPAREQPRPAPEQDVAPPTISLERPEPETEPKTEPETGREPEPEPVRPPPLPPARPAAAARDAVEEEPAAPAAPRPSFEERFGARWSVWIGGLALALGGVFLVRASIEAGLLGPAARIALGALFALALLAGGEWLRRRTAPVAAFGSAYAPGALTAAGCVTAFAVVYAAYALYDFLGPLSAFLLLGVIGISTMLAAALHGPALAAIGLLGAFVGPLLVGGDGDGAWALVPYLAVVAASAYGVAHLRRWLWLAVSAAVGGGLWALPLGFGGSGPLMAHIALQTALAAAAFVVLPYGRDRVARPQIDPVASLVLAGFAGLAVLAMTGSDIGPGARVAFAGGLAALFTGVALRYAPAAVGALLGALVVGGALATWPLAAEIRGAPLTIVPGGAARVPWPEALGLFLGFAALAAVAIAAASGLRLLRGPTLPRLPAALVVAAATGAPLFVLVVVYGALTDQFRMLAAAPSIPFAAVAGLIAAGYAALASQLRDSLAEEGESPRRLLLAGSAAAALAALSAGLVFTLDRGMLTVALALAALGSAWVSDRTRIPTLRWAVGVLGFVVAMRLLDDPVLTDDPGRIVLFNWLLVGYGVPAVAFALAARLLDRTARDGVSRFAESLAFVLGAFMMFFQIRHAVHGGDPLAPGATHLEAGLFATTALAFSVLATRIERLRADPVTHWAGLVFAAVSIAFAGFGSVLYANPLFTGERIIGPPVLNSLLPAYLLPALLAAVLARVAQGVRPAWFVEGAGWLALVLGVLWVGLAVRHGAQGPAIGIERDPTAGEMWAYSAALIAVGVAALALGFVRDARRARLVGVGFFAAAVLKVFLVDLANLEGVMRALSFIGLGLALVGLGLVYQRLVARRPPAPPAAAGG